LRRPSAGTHGGNRGHINLPAPVALSAPDAHAGKSAVRGTNKKCDLTETDTVHSTQTKAGATVGNAVRTVSKDGKTLTFAQKGTHAGGGKFDDVSVYDRQ